ncbi:hypothetical protein VTI74DRAFT_8548 [Chaetomium olivicolor]
MPGQPCNRSTTSITVIARFLLFIHYFFCVGEGKFAWKSDLAKQLPSFQVYKFSPSATFSSFLLFQHTQHRSTFLPQEISSLSTLKVSIHLLSFPSLAPPTPSFCFVSSGPRVLFVPSSELKRIEGIYPPPTHMTLSPRCFSAHHLGRRVPSRVQSQYPPAFPSRSVFLCGRFGRVCNVCAFHQSRIFVLKGKRVLVPHTLFSDAQISSSWVLIHSGRSSSPGTGSSRVFFDLLFLIGPVTFVDRPYRASN